MLTMKIETVEDLIAFAGQASALVDPDVAKIKFTKPVELVAFWRTNVDGNGEPVAEVRP